MTAYGVRPQMTVGGERYIELLAKDEGADEPRVLGELTVDHALHLIRELSRAVQLVVAP